MGVTLLIGNGINRLETEKDYSWEKILADLAQKIGGQYLLELKNDKPLTLIYESLRLKLSVDGKQHGLSLKRKVSKSLLKMVPNQYHSKFLKLGVENIITTNYDYCFERTAKSGTEYFYVPHKSKYSTFRKKKVNDAHIWHIHGEVDVPESIMLGYEQYAGYLQKIRNYLVPSKKSKRAISILLETKLNRKLAQSWTEIFLKDDVYILGFSLDYSEIDIWWLLVLKAECKSRFGINTGTTTYYQWVKDDQKDKDIAKAQLLRSLGVVVIEKYSIGDRFGSCYDEFIKEFRKKQ